MATPAAPLPPPRRDRAGTIEHLASRQPVPPLNTEAPEVKQRLITLRADSVLYTVGYLVIAIGAGCLIVLAISSPKVASLLSFKPLVWIGSLSYGLYLWHLLIYWYLSPPHVNLDPLIAHTIAFALSFVAAAASYYLFERYFLQLKKRVSARPTTHAPAELAPSPPEPVRQSA